MKLLILTLAMPLLVMSGRSSRNAPPGSKSSSNVDQLSQLVNAVIDTIAQAPTRPVVKYDPQISQLQETVKSVAEAAVKHYQDKLDRQQRKEKERLMNEERLNCLIDKRVKRMIEKEQDKKVKYVYVNNGGQQWPNANSTGSLAPAPVPVSAPAPVPASVPTLQQQQQQQPQIYYSAAPQAAHLPT